LQTAVAVLLLLLELQVLALLCKPLCVAIAKLEHGLWKGEVVLRSCCYAKVGDGVITIQKVSNSVVHTCCCLLVTEPAYVVLGT